MDVSQYMNMFLEESKEHLQALNDSLLEIENDPGNLSVLDEIFRSAHTIKGMSATMGFSTIAELTHVMENVLDLLRKSTIAADHDIIDILFQCVDTLEQLIESVASGEDSTADIEPLLARLNKLVQGNDGSAKKQDAKDTNAADSRQEKIPAETPPAAEYIEEEADITIPITDIDEELIKSAAGQGLHAYEVSIALNADCMLKAARVYMVMSALEECGDVIKTAPVVEDLEKGNFETSFQLIILTEADAEKIESAVLSISEIASVGILPIFVKKSAEKTSAADAKASSAPKGQEKTGAAPSEQAPAGSPAAPKIKPPGAAEKNDKPHPAEHKLTKNTQSVRVDIDKLDVLLNLVGELVMNKTRLEQIGITHRLTELVETIEQMDRVTDDLQAVVMKVRMVPVGQVFNRFPRMVRDLSRELNKEINLIIQGEETELDRTVIDEIGDPIMHLLRNSIDHGVEHPDERRAKGKKPVGEVRLIARHEGNNVIIMVEDDGHGINADVVKRKAVEKGVITAAEAEKMEASEAVKLIFAPGFSTADVITDVSGRGVGMDVVKTKIESLGGMVDVETKMNEGSRFKIRLPLTLAIIQALLVKVSDENYAIPLGVIDCTLDISPDDIKTIQNQEVILLRGQIIPIVRLANALCVPYSEDRAPEQFSVVVVYVGDCRIGVIVDTLIGQQEIVIKSVGKLLTGIKVIAGGTVLGNGQVALILDVGALKQS